MYLSKQITATAFCDDFYYSYDLEIDDETLTRDEQKAFSSLSEVSGRFSPFVEDIENHPGVFNNEATLREKILDTKYILRIDEPG